MKKNLFLANREKFKIVELKTLNDFPFSEILINDLRREAIRWVKDCCPEKIPESLGASPSRCDGCERQMKFCNITEGDLK